MVPSPTATIRPIACSDTAMEIVAVNANIRYAKSRKDMSISGSQSCHRNDSVSGYIGKPCEAVLYMNAEQVLHALQ